MDSSRYTRWERPSLEERRARRAARLAAANQPQTQQAAQEAHAMTLEKGNVKVHWNSTATHSPNECHLAITVRAHVKPAAVEGDAPTPWTDVDIEYIDYLFSQLKQTVSTAAKGSGAAFDAL